MSEVTSFQLDHITQEQDYKKKQMVNMITRNIEDKDNYFIISRMEHIFQTWREISAKNARIMRQFNLLVTRNHLAEGF